MATTVDIERGIRDAIEKSAKEIREEIIVEAVRRFELDLRDRVGRIAINVSDYFSVERLASDLVIRVKIETPLR